MATKKNILGQYFTKEKTVRKLLKLIEEYRVLGRQDDVLEPSFGTGSFIKILKEQGFEKIAGCEIDPELTGNPSNFFDLPLSKKFSLIIGNPPFTKYNIEESYYGPDARSKEFLTGSLSSKTKVKIEDAFIMKSMKHLKDKNSMIAFVLPISFFIKNKNAQVKEQIFRNFSTVLIYQDEEKWFDEPIPCCFAVFTSIKKYEGKLILIHEDRKKTVEKEKLLTEELIPKTLFYKESRTQEGKKLSAFLNGEKVKYQVCYNTNNINAANIVRKKNIPPNRKTENYQLAVVRVGNSSLGRSGLINPDKDILNGMFYVFRFKKKYDRDKTLKEKICGLINENQDYFRNSTIRVGSKSIKKDEILSFKVKI